MISITKKEIKDCLLGKYDAEKESEFLAACFSDGENTEKFEIVRQDLIESYLRGVLSKEEKKLFEENFLKDEHNRELLGFAETLRNHLSENRQLAEIAAKPEKKSFAFDNLLIPVGGLAILAVVSFLVWQIFLRKDGNDVVQTNPTPTPTEQVSPTPTVSPNQTVSPLPANNSNIVNSPANQTSPNNTSNENQNENSYEKNKPVQRNPVFAAIANFRLPMGLKNGEEILEITPKLEKINFQTTIKPEKTFPKYIIRILPLSGNNEKIYENPFDEFPDEFTVEAGKFKEGKYQFTVTGINANGSSEELKGIESRFRVKIMKK